MSSDDSDFYGEQTPVCFKLVASTNTIYLGDDEVMADLKAKVKGLDVKAWWGEYQGLDTPLKLQARKKEK